MKNMRVFNKIMSVVLAVVMVLSMLPMSVFATEATQTDVDVGETTAVDAVAKVGNTEYATIDEAVANWTNGSTLTLLSDVTLSDVIKLSSTEYHILDLDTYTMTAASGKNAIEITCAGRSSASYALTINADAENTGGISATGTSCIYYKKSDTTKDRPIIVINNGVFNGSYSINCTSNGNTNCPQFWINGGIFKAYMNLTKTLLKVTGGYFDCAINCTGDQNAYRLFSGGTFKQWQFMTSGPADNGEQKLTVGNSKNNFDNGVYIDDNGYLVVGGPVITEAGETFEASSANYGGFSSYLQYSSAKDNGLYYTSVEEALADNNKTTGSVTVYVDELNMTDSNYKGTIVVPEGKTITIVAVADTTPTWKVEGAVTYVDTSGNELVRGEDGSFAVPAPPAPTGSITHVYTGTTGFWGEGGGNAKESLVVELYEGDAKIASAALNNIGGIIDGDVYVTWNVPFAGSNDEYWTVEWATGYPKCDMAPTRGVMVIDGVAVAENVVKYNGPDDLNKIVALTEGGAGVAAHTTLAEAIKAAAPNGTVEIVADVTVDKWVMIAESLSIGSGQIITLEINGMTINGNGHTLTINAIESASNGDYLFYDAKNLNVNDLTIKYADGLVGGIGLKSGTVSGVTSIGGKYSVIPGDGNVTVTGCTFKTGVGYAIYFEKDRDNLVVEGNTFEVADGGYAITLRGAAKFIDNEVTSGRVNLAGSASGVVSGNDFNDVRFKVYNTATATIEKNEINNLVFNDETVTKATFTDNTLSQAAEDALAAVTASNVAEVNGVGYATLEEAFAAAAEGDTITLLADATPALTSQRAITKAAVIDLGGKTLTLTEDDLYFGTTTFKNGSIVVDPSVRPSTAVFWMFANQTLTFDNVKLTATGVTGTYLIGLDGNNSDLNLIKGSEIIVENTTALDLDIICVNASTGNDILIADSKVSVTNLDGRVFFRGNYTVSGTSDIDLSGITKAGFRIEAGQTLSIEDTATVDIVGEPRDGGIHLTDVTAAYTKADTATVNATINAPTPAYVAEINGVGYATLQAAIDAVQAGDEIVLLADVAETVTTPNGITLNGNGFTIDGTVTAGGNLTFVGHTKVTSFSAGFYDHTVTIGEGACLEVTGTGRVTLGYGNVFNITGSIENAKTADKSAVAPSLIIPGGISITGGNDAEMNVTNAYIKLGNTSSKNSAANGTFEVNFTNSIVEFTNQFTLSQPTNGNTPTFKVNVKDSVMTLVAKLCIYAPDTEFVVDNSKVSTANNLHNSGELILKNGSELTAGMIQFGENGGNDGIITVDASTLTINNNNSAHAMDGNNVGKLVLKNGGTAKVDYIVETKIEVDGTDFSGEPKLVLATKNLADATNTVTVIGAAYEITAEGLVLKEKTLSGKGTEAEPFLIKDLDDLILFRDSVNAGETKYNAPGVYVALDADIDMAGTDWSVNIGDDCNATFDGIFDGKGHTISNLTATETEAKADGYVCTGLFGAIYGSAVIKNLTIENVAINTGDFTGNNAAAVVGFAYSCTGSVENVKVTGDIKINAKNVTGTGAIVGYDYYGKLTVKDCSVAGNDGSYITGAAYVGGVIGYASTNSNASGNTVEHVAITAQCCVGGVAGIMLNNGKAEGNTVKNVTLTATHENWQNSAAAVVGAISGGTVTVSGTTVENVNTAALVGANMTEEHPSAPVEKVEAAIGNTYYGTLEAAINAAKGQTITLLVPYVVEAGETVTLDLKGQTVVMEKAEKVTANHAMILNKGNLTINDSVGGGKLTYQYTGENLGVTYAVTTITSNPGSTLTVEGGTIENLTYDNSVIAYAIDGLTNGGLGDVTVNINGGTIIGLRQAVRIFANSTTNTGTLNITGGDITGRVIVQNANANANKAVLEITGGTFNANSYKTEVLYVGGINGAQMAINATVSGGTFKGEVASSVPNGFITDGTFKSDVTAFCAEGYTCEQNADGTYGVVKEEQPEVTMTLNLLNLRLQDLIRLGFYFKVETEETVSQVGALLWTADEYAVETDFTITSVNAYNAAAETASKTDPNQYVVETEGIYAQNLDTVYHIIPYVVLESGEYVYSDQAKSSSALVYANIVYNGDYSEDEKSIVIDLLNYATAAREYFCIRENMNMPEEAFNSILSESDRTVNWSDDLKAEYPGVSELTGTYEPTFKFLNTNLNEAIKLNFGFEGRVHGIGYWTADEYAEQGTHNATNMAHQATMNYADAYCWGAIENLYSFHIYSNFFAMAYDEEGNCSRTYGASIASYLSTVIDTLDAEDEENAAMIELAKAMLVYGDNAKNNPTVNKGSN